MFEVVCGVHNHLAAEHLEGHSFVGRLSEEETKLSVDMSKSIVSLRLPPFHKTRYNNLIDGAV